MSALTGKRLIMDEKQSEAKPSTDFLQTWLTMANQFWSGFPGMTAGRPAETGTAPEGQSRTSQEALLSIMKTWGTFSSALSEPSALNTITSGMEALPDIMARFFQTSLGSFLKVAEQLQDKLKDVGKRTEAYTFDNLDKDTIGAWSDFYDKEISQYLKVPQLGLVRFYQERFNQTIDKFNIFNATLAGFIQILMLPFEKTFKVMQDKIEEQIRGRSIPEDLHEYYRMWLKILEGHFMTLFKSPEYTKALAETLKAYEEYLSSRNRIIEDTMQSLPIPTNKDLDELYEEIYQLKKRIKDLEKAQKDHRKS
jgi:poly[(R)-3-hydroxyalkanoate] polymerase subunit PhaE